MPNPIVEKKLAFSLLAIEYCAQLENVRKYVVAKQLLRAATAIGASVLEAQHAESRNDFIHKMKISEKRTSVGIGCICVNIQKTIRLIHN